MVHLEFMLIGKILCPAIKLIKFKNILIDVGAEECLRERKKNLAESRSLV